MRCARQEGRSADTAGDSPPLLVANELQWAASPTASAGLRFKQRICSRDCRWARLWVDAPKLARQTQALYGEIAATHEAAFVPFRKATPAARAGEMPYSFRNWLYVYAAGAGANVSSITTSTYMQ